MGDINIHINNGSSSNEKETSDSKNKIYNLLTESYENIKNHDKKEIDEMIEEIDKYYNINHDRNLRNIIEDMLKARYEFILNFDKFKSWYNKNR